MSCSAGFQQRLQGLLSEKGGWDSGAASLLPPLLLLLFGVCCHNAAILVIKSMTNAPGAGASDSEGDNSNLRPPCSPLLPLRLPGPTKMCRMSLRDYLQVRLYLWLIASSLIFPIIISSGGNLVDLWQVSICQYFKFKRSCRDVPPMPSWIVNTRNFS